MSDEGCRESRPERFADQLRAQRGRVFAYVLRRVANNRMLAEDVTQDCFVRVWQARERSPLPPGALYAYLLTTARNLIRDRLRRREPLQTGGWEEAETEVGTGIEDVFLAEVSHQLEAGFAHKAGMTQVGGRFA